MNEQQWESSESPEQMLLCVRDKANDQRLRFFAISCVRQFWDILTCDEDRCLATLSTAEMMLDNRLPQAEIDELRSHLRTLASQEEYCEDRWDVDAALAVTEASGFDAAMKTVQLLSDVYDFAWEQANIMMLPGLACVTSKEELERLVGSEGFYPGWREVLENWENLRDTSVWGRDAARLASGKIAIALRYVIGNPFQPAQQVKADII